MYYNPRDQTLRTVINFVAGRLGAYVIYTEKGQSLACDVKSGAIHIPVKFLEYPQSAVLGGVIHEAGHLKHTTYLTDDDMEKYLKGSSRVNPSGEELPPSKPQQYGSEKEKNLEELVRFGGKKFKHPWDGGDKKISQETRDTVIAHTVLNAIEDYRIDNRLIEQYPGARNWLEELLVSADPVTSLNHIQQRHPDEPKAMQGVALLMAVAMANHDPDGKVMAAVIKQSKDSKKPLADLEKLLKLLPDIREAKDTKALAKDVLPTVLDILKVYLPRLKFPKQAVERIGKGLGKGTGKKAPQYGKGKGDKKGDEPGGGFGLDEPKETITPTFSANPALTDGITQALRSVRLAAVQTQLPKQRSGKLYLRDAIKRFTNPAKINDLKVFSKYRKPKFTKPPDVILVVDTSGSMSWCSEAVGQLTDSLTKALGNTGGNFGMITFSSKPKTWKRLVKKSWDVPTGSQQLHFGGGTDDQAALEAALKQLQERGVTPNKAFVILVTDGDGVIQPGKLKKFVDDFNKIGAELISIGITGSAWGSPGLSPHYKKLTHPIVTDGKLSGVEIKLKAVVQNVAMELMNQ